MNSFMALLESRWNEEHFLCVGLDTDYEKLPAKFEGKPVADALFEFNREIVKATAPFCAVFKPNIAFYEGYGPEGISALMETNRFIREHYPMHPIILDAKRADIGNTNNGYVKAAFEVFQAHAITVHPYLGREAMEPFLAKKDRGVIVLCHTSNLGAGEFQELKTGYEELYKVVAAKVSREWNYNGNCGLVVGATFPQQLAEVRAIAGDLPILIPGVGAQGGDLDQTVLKGINSAGEGIIINASRSVIYASSGDDFAEAAAAEANRLEAEIRRVRATIVEKAK